MRLVTELATESCTKVIVALADLVGLATLVAVTITVWLLLNVAGAVYDPLDRAPIAGVNDQVTAVLIEPVTVAVNCSVWDGDRLVLVGPRVIETGVKATTAVAILVGSARLRAVTLTFFALIVVGAVYKPLLEIVPTSGLIDHHAPILLDPPIVAVNCCDWEAVKLVLVGAIVIETGVKATTSKAWDSLVLGLRLC